MFDRVDAKNDWHMNYSQEVLKVQFFRMHVSLDFIDTLQTDEYIWRDIPAGHSLCRKPLDCDLNYRLIPRSLCLQFLYKSMQ